MGQNMDMAREPDCIDRHYEYGNPSAGEGSDRTDALLDRLFGEMARDRMSPALTRMLIENKLLLPHR